MMGKELDMRESFVAFSDGAWRIVKGRKHGPCSVYPCGKDLEKVAQEDPGYLKWVFKEVGPTLPDEAFYALDDCVIKYRILE